VVGSLVEGAALGNVVGADEGRRVGGVDGAMEGAGEGDVDGADVGRLVEGVVVGVVVGGLVPPVETVTDSVCAYPVLKSSQYTCPSISRDAPCHPSPYESPHTST